MDFPPKISDLPGAVTPEHIHFHKVTGYGRNYQANHGSSLAQERSEQQYRPKLPFKPLALRDTEPPPFTPQSPITRPGHCCSCRRSVRTWKCVQCDDLFCDDCWPKERPHRSGRVGFDGRPHEKVDEGVVDRMQQVFGQPSKREQDLRHESDICTTWFGVDREGENSFLHYSNRLVDLLQEQAGDGQERFPQLVSFVGQTGAGKSTIIKMLINREQARTEGNGQASSPVPGLVGDNIATTGNVHLYADPGTQNAQKPIFYADCEGMQGGEHPPRGLACREMIEIARKSKQVEKNKLRKRISCGDLPKKKTREFAVRKLFPRILYTFSDVVVFVLREVRTFQTEVLKQLVMWGAASVDKSLNQPILPHVIIAVNAADSGIDEGQWDPEHATQELMRDYENSVHQVPELREILAKFDARDRRPHTTKDLLERYYSSVTVVKIPSKGRYMQIDDQIGKLYHLIGSKCIRSHADKKRVRLSLNAERLPQYVSMAYDHFSTEMDEPFDFVEAARQCAPLPQGFGQHVLNLILSLALYNPGTKNGPEHILSRLSPFIASCIMLAVIRDNTQGAYEDLLWDTYRDPLLACLTEFSDNWLRCSYKQDGVQCWNAKNSHSKGHQSTSGKILKQGEYESTFDLDSVFCAWMEDIRRKIQLHNLQLQNQDFGEEIHHIDRLHRKVVETFYGETTSESASDFKSHLTCLYCVRKVPESILPCGHILCKPCIQALGRDKEHGWFELDCCPLHPRETRWPERARIRFKPRDAGVRVLCMDGGGVRGLVELAFLEAMEEELGGAIPIQNFFDLIVGTSTGGIIALGLGIKQWTVAECQRKFRTLVKKAFTKRSFKPLAILSHKSYYKTEPLEAALVQAFDNTSLLYGGPKRDSSASIRVAVTSTIANENRPVILSNYSSSGEREHLPYQFVRPREPCLELKIWEAARATAAAPLYFKPFQKLEVGRAFTDGAIHNNCPVRVADTERKLLWEEVSDWPADILLSLGTGLSGVDRSRRSAKYSSIPGEPANTSRRTIAGLSYLWRTANSIIDDQLNCEKIWKDYHADLSLPAKLQNAEIRRRNIRLNVAFEGDRPRLDDIKSLEHLEQEAQRLIEEQNPTIVEVAHRLVASCFYFDKTGCPPPRVTGEYVCFGNIRCRLEEGSKDLRGLGSILQRFTCGTMFEPSFFLQEDYQGPSERKHEIPIPIETVRNMCSNGSFKLPTNLTIRGSGQSSLTRLSLRLRSGFYGETSGPSCGGSMGGIEPYLSISGFPRELWTQDNPLSPSTDPEDQPRAFPSCHSPTTGSFQSPSEIPVVVTSPTEAPTVLRKKKSLFSSRTTSVSGLHVDGNKSETSVASLAVSEGAPTTTRSSTDTMPKGPAVRSISY